MNEVLTEDLLSLKEAASLLGVSEDEVKELIKKHRVPSHQVAGAFLRFKRKEIEGLKNKWRIERELFPSTPERSAPTAKVLKAGFFDRILDFWHFNDFYILCTVLIALLLYVVLSYQ